MKDFMIEGKRYVFKDTLNGMDLVGIPAEMLKMPVMMVAIIASKTLIEPIINVEEVLKLPLITTSKIAEIINELYLNQFELEE